MTNEKQMKGRLAPLYLRDLKEEEQCSLIATLVKRNNTKSSVLLRAIENKKDIEIGCYYAEEDYEVV